MASFWKSKQAAYGEAIILLALGGLVTYLKPAIGVPLLLVLLAFGIFLVWRSYKRSYVESSHNDGLTLLGLLDEAYQRLKLITRLTIRKMRSEKWKDVTSAYPNFMGLSDIDIDDAIDEILLKNVFFFTVGKPMTIEEDGKQLAKKVLRSSLFTRNPEHIAKDASVILQEKVPYLKKKLDHDRTYKKLLKRIERERDKFPSEDISNKINEYLDHSIKINAAWVLSTYDLDHEGMVGRFPMKLKIILWGLPGRMDEEMRGLRTQVAITILESNKEKTI